MWTLISGLVALTACILLAYLITSRSALWLADAGVRWGAVTPVTDRGSHENPVSYLGGIAIALGFIIPCIVFIQVLWWMPHLEFSWGANRELLGWLALGGVGMMLVGLADDLWGLPALVKLAGQFAATLVLPLSSFRFLNLEVPTIDGLNPDLAATVVSMVWIVFFVNVFNFMDGTDGIAIRFAMTVGFCLTLAILIVGAIGGNFLYIRGEVFLLPILGAAANGFYHANKPPAKIFMGDSGSHLVGYVLAVFLIFVDGQFFFVTPGFSAVSPVVPLASVLILLLPFIFDVVLTLLRRARRGENLLAAHHSHLYQRLIDCGLTHRDVLRTNLEYFRVCGLLSITYMFSGVIAPAVDLESRTVEWIIWALAFGVLFQYWLRVVLTERRSGRAPGAGAGVNSGPGSGPGAAAPAAKSV